MQHYRGLARDLWGVRPRSDLRGFPQQGPPSPSWNGFHVRTGERLALSLTSESGNLPSLHLFQISITQNIFNTQFCQIP